MGSTIKVVYYLINFFCFKFNFRFYFVNLPWVKKSGISVMNSYLNTMKKYFSLINKLITFDGP
jgi:hypothetical protein